MTYPMTKSSRHEANVLVVNYTAPELNHLAAALASRKILRSYIRPYAYQGRALERFLATVPGLGRLHKQTFGRRTMPEGLGPDHIREIALWHDLARVTIGHFGGTACAAISDRLHWDIQKRLAEAAGQHARDARLVVGAYVVSRKAFTLTCGIKVLNYPIAHHRFIQRFVAEEREREPSFAGTLPDWGKAPSWVEPELDAECELADRILVGSTFARDAFVEENVPAWKMVVVPYGADLSRFSPATQQTEERCPFRILFVGSIGQRKGISYLLRAYRRFKAANTELVLVGNLPDNRTAFAPFRDDFRHIAHVPQAELPGLYQGADVFVFPTLLEGMPLVVLEAMACGLPVITTANGPGDIVRDGIDGFIVPIRDSDAIAEKLEYLRANPDRMKEMGYNARRRALEYSWSAYQERVSIVIDRLLATTPQ